jgi:hypothetical protein
MTSMGRQRKRPSDLVEVEGRDYQSVLKELDDEENNKSSGVKGYRRALPCRIDTAAVGGPDVRETIPGDPELLSLPAVSGSRDRSRLIRRELAPGGQADRSVD